MIRYQKIKNYIKKRHGWSRTILIVGVVAAFDVLAVGVGCGETIDVVVGGVNTVALELPLLLDEEPLFTSNGAFGVVFFWFNELFTENENGKENQGWALMQCQMQ